MKKAKKNTRHLKEKKVIPNIDEKEETDDASIK